MNANALVLKPIGNGESVNVAGDLIIGRNPDCDLVLQSGTVSGKHARLSLKDSVALLEDLGSTNGTFVNDQRIERAELKNGDRVRFDVVEFDVVMQRAGAATQVRSGTVVRSLKEEDKPPKAATGGEQAPKPPAAASSKPAVPAKEPQPAPRAAAPKAEPPAAEMKAAPKAEPPAAPKAEPAGAGAKAERPSVAPPDAAPKADKPSVAPGATKSKPGSWAFDGAPKGKTQLLTREQLEEMLKAPAADEQQRADFNQPYLQVLSGKLRGNYLRLELLHDTNTWTLGSDAAARDIVLDDAGVSAYHAKLVNEGNRWKVVDQLSQNGTYVNDAKVTARFLSSGDRLKFGSVQCVFRLPGAKEAKTDGRAARSARSWLVAAVSFAVTAAVLFLLLRWLR
jgi:pSer/pThr/pTyr-binding forkhead associated (FHA) protein